MPRWTTRTMLRELREYKKDLGLTGGEALDDVLHALEETFIEEEMSKSLRSRDAKQG